MYITEIRFQRYKSITEPRTLHPQHGLSVFIGKNNSGKSTVLDALYKFFRPLQDPIRYGDTEAHIEVDVDLTQKDRKQLSKFDKQIKDYVTLVLHSDALSMQTEQESKPLSRDLSAYLVQHTIRIGAIRDLDFVKMQKIFDEFKTGWPKVFKVFSEKIHLLFPEIKTPSRLFEQKGDTIQTNIKEFGHDRTIERLGLGFRHIFIILLYYFHPRYDIILIDEPEIHLHPQMVKRVNDIFEENISQKQIFITTHSPLFIQPRNLPHVYRTVQSENQGTHFHSLGEKKLNENRLIQELNADNVEMFLADHVLLVEGISDRIFIRELLRRFYETSIDIKVIPVHGKENIDTYAEILEDFHIPYTLLLDKDAFGDRDIAVLENSGIQGSFEVAQPLFIQKGIYILPFGDLEHHYPKHLFERDTSKPLLALHVSNKMTQEEFGQGRMKIIKALLDHITQQ